MPAPRLVIIDDDDAFARRVADLSGRVGFEATVSSDGHDFKRLCGENPPDVVVLELVLQDVDGIELVRWLIDRGSAAQIIVISAYSPSYARAVEVLARNQGRMAVTNVEKPVNDRTLLASLRKAMAAVRGRTR